MSKNKEKNELDAVLKQIKKAYGEGSILWLGKEEHSLHVETIPSGSIALDMALGVGGIPKGRIVEIFGMDGSGKSTLALHMIAEAQKKGGKAAFIDVEHALDPDYAEAIGVDLENLLISQPDSGEQALEIVEQLINSCGIDIIVVDSVAALLPTAESEGRIGDSFVGLQARLMSQSLRKLSGAIARSKTIVVFTNQMRSTIGASRFGPTKTTSGGFALKFYASVRLQLWPSGKIEEGSERVGHCINAKVVKNKVATPFKIAELDIIYGKGIVRSRDLINTGIKYGVVERSGAWYSFDGEKIGQGMVNSSKFLEENPKIANKIEKAIRESVK